MTPPTLGPAVTPHQVRPIEETADPNPDRPLLRLYVGPRFFLGAVPLPLRAWSGIPKLSGEQPLITALAQWREGARERLGWSDWEVGIAASSEDPVAPAAAGCRSVVLEPPAADQETLPRSVWTTPSAELTFKMLGVERERWPVILGKEEDFDAALERLRDELREDLVATIADVALTALENQQQTVVLTVKGRFVAGIRDELFRILPIDPYVAPESLDGLYQELLAQVRQEPLRASWGDLCESAGELTISLRQPASKLISASADAPTVP